jgi:signal transduction histidine kinase
MREIKEKEAENLRMVQKVEQSQRLDALGQLAAGVAHDFNNLLGVIQNHAELVEMKLGSETKAAKNLSAILQATTRARDIVLKLNALGRERKRLEQDGSVHDEEEVLVPFELLPVIEETQGLLQATLKGIDIVVDGQALTSGVILRGQSGTLQQVIVNGSHAIGDRRDGLIGIRLGRPDAHHVSIAVSDNGDGIPAEIMSRIFEPFFTTKEVGKGTGLGLAMVRSIITQMGGNIDCVSVPGQGTTFTISLPCTQA